MRCLAGVEAAGSSYSLAEIYGDFETVHVFLVDGYSVVSEYPFAYAGHGSVYLADCFVGDAVQQVQVSVAPPQTAFAVRHLVKPIARLVVFAET